MNSLERKNRELAKEVARLRAEVQGLRAALEDEPFYIHTRGPQSKTAGETARYVWYRVIRKDPELLEQHRAYRRAKKTSNHYTPSKE